MMVAVDGARRVAVIIPCFDEGALVAEAVASVREDEPVEVAVVDDCSTDAATVAVLERLRADGVRVIRHEGNRGVIAARMTGLRGTSAPYVFPLDADDLAVPGALAAMADRLERDQGAAVCFGDYREFGDHELVRAVPEALDPYRVMYANEYPVSALFRRSVLEAVGGWEAGGYGDGFYEDWHLWMSLAERGARGVHLGAGRPTYQRRVHGDRRLAMLRLDHRARYRRLRHIHAELFANRRVHRRHSDLGTARKVLYPVVYGGRPRFAFERGVKRLLDRAGVWTLRR